MSINNIQDICINYALACISYEYISFLLLNVAQVLLIKLWFVPYIHKEENTKSQ